MDAKWKVGRLEWDWFNTIIEFICYINERRWKKLFLFILITMMNFFPSSLSSSSCFFLYLIFIRILSLFYHSLVGCLELLLCVFLLPSILRDKTQRLPFFISCQIAASFFFVPYIICVCFLYFWTVFVVCSWCFFKVNLCI